MHMKYTLDMAGKWIAVRRDKAVDSSKNLGVLMKRVGKRKDYEEIRYAYVPKGLLAGIVSYGI